MAIEKSGNLGQGALSTPIGRLAAGLLTGGVAGAAGGAAMAKGMAAGPGAAAPASADVGAAGAAPALNQPVEVQQAGPSGVDTGSGVPNAFGRRMQQMQQGGYGGY